MATNATTQKKDSGILRYMFSFAGPSGLPPAFANPLVGGAAPAIITCLGADADVNPDQDNQVFGAFPGHAAITGKAGTLFSGSNLVARTTPDPIGVVVPGAQVQAGGRIPGSTKVFAWFNPEDIVTGASTVPGEQPYVIVQTEVVQNRIFDGTAVAPDGPQLLSSIRVAVKNVGHSSSVVAGTLFVKIQHSILDIPGLANQDQIGISTQS